MAEGAKRDGTGPGETGSGAAGDAAPCPPQGWRALLAKLDGPLKYVKDLSFFSFVAVLAMAFFQFNQWSIEKTLDRAKSDYDLATQTFDELIRTLANAQNLQEILFFTYRSAADASPESAAFFLKQAQAIYKDYTQARLGLRTGMDRLVYRTQLYVDWASDLDSDKSLRSRRYTFDPLSDTQLDRVKFDCATAQSVPDYRSFSDLKAVSFGGISVDWRSAKHQLVIFYHCFDDLHGALLPARMWAAEDAPAGVSPVPTGAQSELVARAVMPVLDNQVLRLNGLSMLLMTRIEQIRRLNALPSFLDYYLRNRDRIVTKPD